MSTRDPHPPPASNRLRCERTHLVVAVHDLRLDESPQRFLNRPDPTAYVKLDVHELFLVRAAHATLGRPAQILDVIVHPACVVAAHVSEGSARAGQRVKEHSIELLDVVLVKGVGGGPAKGCGERLGADSGGLTAGEAGKESLQLERQAERRIRISIRGVSPAEHVCAELLPPDSFSAWLRIQGNGPNADVELTSVMNNVCSKEFM